MTFCTEIHDAKMMAYNDFSDPLTFDLVPPAVQHFPLFENYLKYLSIYEMDWYKLLYRQSSQMMYPCNFCDSLTFPIPHEIHICGFE